ncbi:MAG: polynucleotide kinase-phosphatase [Anaerolineae bacterium]|nr:polynucleotide kinase-phosphatase [Anaerolineae bacterium]
MTNLNIPELSLVVLIGASGSGKSSFARKHFRPTEVMSSDFCRGLVSDDENDQTATKDAFEILHFITAKRLAAGRLTVVDATNVQSESRKPLIELARKYHVLPIAIVFNIPEKVCQERNRNRPDRDFGPHVIRQQTQQLRRSLRDLKYEGFRQIYILDSVESIDSAVISRQPLWNNLKHLHGPFDIIGDVHGCFDELVKLLEQLGYNPVEKNSVYHVQPPTGRHAIFLGDLVDRGPKIPDVLKLVMGMVTDGIALCIPGNHDLKLVRALKGKQVQITHGLADSLEQLKSEPPEFSTKVMEFLDGLISHYVLDDGKLVVAHAGMKEEMQGRGSGKVRDFALYGETTGETDEFGLPIRYNWTAEYRGRAIVVYGHTPVPEPEWLNRTINIDTGCVFGGRLTALRYPERELISVPAAQTYAQPLRSFLAPEDQAPVLSAQHQHDDMLNIDDVLGKRIISTRLHHNVTIREENATAALEVMSRFATNPKWLIYLPPTMSPSETTQQPGLLEHPAEAFAYYRHEGVNKVVCEEKHMGSRAVVIICRDENVARERFGVTNEGIGVCYTRTGRRFFNDPTLETEFIERIHAVVEKSGLWEELKTDWLCLDCELMPWSAKAIELVRQQYASVGVSARAGLTESVSVLENTGKRDRDIIPLLERYRERVMMADQFVDAYRRYCWPVQSIEDFKLAPFHLLASEGIVHVDKDHIWHMMMLSRLSSDSLIFPTPYKLIDVTDTVSQAEGITWWDELTGRGGEGMVVKPFTFVAKGQRGLIQPAIKCRGREYLRIIYGPEYTMPENLERLRTRGTARKRSLALREFALGVEALERFVRHEPLYRMHECVFGVLALESEPVDIRL